MSKKAFDTIATGLEDALAMARGDLKPARVYVPPEIDVRTIRRALDMSQDDFAQAFGFTVSQVRYWEQGRSRPLTALRAYLMIIQRNPAAVLDILHDAKAA